MKTNLKSGVMLIEVLFAMMIVSVSVVVLSGIMLVAIARNRAAVQRVSATRFAQASVEWLKHVDSDFGTNSLIDLTTSGSVSFCLDNLNQLGNVAELLSIPASCGPSAYLTDSTNTKYHRSMVVSTSGGKVNYVVTLNWQTSGKDNTYQLDGTL